MEQKHHRTLRQAQDRRVQTKYERIDTPQEHHTWVELSKSAINHNITQYKKAIRDQILAPVIKSNAYGHGLVEVARICEENKDVGWLCTATLSEALILRKNNITKPILVLSYIGQHAEQAILQNIALVAYDLHTIQKLNKIGKQYGKICNIHIKIDTGLSRLGVPSEQAVAFIKEVSSYDFIHIQGIWTHFAESHAQDRSFTNQQLQRFEDVVTQLETHDIHIELKHVANSAATTTLYHGVNNNDAQGTKNTTRGNFFRLGVGMYGYWPSAYVKAITQKKYPSFTLKPTMTWKTKIFHIKDIKKGNFISYNREHQVARDSKIALIPTGYFDGYDLRLSNKAFVLIHGKLAPTVGRICMNITVIDITKLKEVNIGDEVILLGDHPYVNASTLSQACSLNPREITTKVHPEIPRIIIE